MLYLLYRCTCCTAVPLYLLYRRGSGLRRANCAGAPAGAAPAEAIPFPKTEDWNAVSMPSLRAGCPAPPAIAESSRRESARAS